MMPMVAAVSPEVRVVPGAPLKSFRRRCVFQPTPNSADTRMDVSDSGARGICPPPDLGHMSTHRFPSAPRHSEGSHGVSSSPPTSESEEDESSDDASMGLRRPSLTTPEPVRLVFTDDSDDDHPPEPHGLTPPRVSGGRKRTAEMSSGLDSWEAIRHALSELPHAKRRRQVRATSARARGTTVDFSRWCVNHAPSAMARD
eukprot:Hpha_TRINITY_DN15150_c0_g1::TRINITY_DN15150_c0_g1_i1::g.126853::m.126853